MTQTQDNNDTAITAPATNPMTIIEAAVGNGCDPDKLEKLMGLQERWEANKASQAFNDAMAAAQAGMPVVLRDKKNSQTNSFYASLEQVLKTCKPVWLSHGLSLSFGEAPCDQENWIRIECTVRHVAGHCEKYHMTGPLDDAGIKGSKNKTLTHAAASTRSYLERYLVVMVFNLTVGDEDNDGNKPGPVISDDQLLQLEAKLADCGGDVEAFKRWADIKTLADLPVSKLDAAYGMIRKKERASASS